VDVLFPGISPSVSRLCLTCSATRCAMARSPGLEAYRDPPLPHGSLLARLHPVVRLRVIPRATYRCRRSSGRPSENSGVNAAGSGGPLLWRNTCERSQIDCRTRLAPARASASSLTTADRRLRSFAGESTKDYIDNLPPLDALHVIIIGIFGTDVSAARRRAASGKAISPAAPKWRSPWKAHGRAINLGHRAARPRHHRRRNAAAQHRDGRLLDNRRMPPSTFARKFTTASMSSRTRPRRHLKVRIRPNSSSGRRGREVWRW